MTLTSYLSNEQKDQDGKVDLGHTKYYLNRELSELEFNRRVLSEATDVRNPLLERVKFLAIFSSNMDEFFMKRLGGLKRKMDSGVQELTPDGRTPTEHWEAILDKTHSMVSEQIKCYRLQIRPQLKKEGIVIASYRKLEQQDQKYLRQFMERQVLPLDYAHSFPFVSNLSLSLAVLTRREKGATPQFVGIEIPNNRPRLVRIKDSLVFVPLDQIVGENLDLLFSGVDILGYHTFRATRNANVQRNEEEAGDPLAMIEEELRKRRFAPVVRLEVQYRTPQWICQILMDGLRIDPRELFKISGFINTGDLLALSELPLPKLKKQPWQPRVHPRLRQGSPEQPTNIFDEIRRRDILVHHPYQSYSETVDRFIQEACNDPDVLAIKMVIYRTARQSETLNALVRAVKEGKQVAVVIELRARFSEQLNMEWARDLEEVGVHVSYGMFGLKTHCKVALVVRQEQGRPKRYAHIATGNYHSETAKIYTDLGLLTADEECCQDVADLFNSLTGHTGNGHYRKLAVAPMSIRKRFIGLIRKEADFAKHGKKAQIIAKMNALEDPEIIRELYLASMEGVRIDLIVRGMCRLRPGLEPVSENIRVISVVGHFLEHSRIFYFMNGGDPIYYIGSADWMQRNFDQRVEAAVPVTDVTLQDQVKGILETILSDNRRAWEMRSNGSYRQRKPAPREENRDSQERLMRLAAERCDDSQARTPDETVQINGTDSGFSLSSRSHPQPVPRRSSSSEGHSPSTPP